MKKVWLLYDGRARMGADTDDCAIMVSCNSRRSLWSDSRQFSGTDSIWAEYDLINNEATNERLLPELHKDILCGRKP